MRESRRERERERVTTARWPSERLVKAIHRATGKHYSAEDKIRIVLDGLRGDSSITELCRRDAFLLEATLKLSLMSAVMASSKVIALHLIRSEPKDDASTLSIATEDFLSVRAMECAVNIAP